MLGKSPLDLASLISTKPWVYTLKIITNVNEKQTYHKVKIMKITLKMFASIFFIVEVSGKQKEDFCL